MKTIYQLIVLAGLCIFHPLILFPQAGTLDPAFGNNGIVMFNSAPDIHDRADDIYIYPDNSMLTAGNKMNFSYVATGVLQKFLEDGSVDSTWGTNGVVEFQFGEDTFPYNMIILADGKILVSGVVFVTVQDGEFFIARFNPDGSTDNSFNGTGVWIGSYSSGEKECNAMVIQPDGKIVLAGQTGVSTGNLLFARIDGNGTLDQSFGTNGYTEINYSVQSEGINSLGLLSNGNIIGMGDGYQSTPWYGQKAIMVKLDANGNPLTGFGTNGVLVPSIFDDLSTAKAMVIVNDSLLVTGWINDAGNNQNIFLAKLDSSGIAEPSFGNNGIIATYIDPITMGLDMLRTDNGRVYVCGTTGANIPRDFLLMRYRPDGSLDPSFNGTGIVTTDIRVDWDDANALAMQYDGKIVLAGFTSGLNSSGDNDVALSRYLNDYTPPGCFAGFTADNTLNCEGSQVQFTDQSWSTDGTIQTWNWIFEGGTPATSTDQNPVVTYSSAGIYDVQLAVYDGTYYDTLFMEDFIMVEAIPAQPDTPGGPADLCGGYEGDYTTNEVTYAGSYQWQVTPTAAGTISGTTTTATFTASSYWTGTCTISVRAQGYCGNGPWSEGLSVNVAFNPSQFQMMGDGAFCSGDPGAEIILDGSETGVDYELYLDGDPTGIIEPGTGSPINFGYYNTVGLYEVFGYTDTCSEFMIGQVYVHELSPPEQANMPVGPEMVCDGETTFYTTLQIDDADVYIWTLDPVEAGVPTPVYDTVYIDWAPGFSGTASLSVHGENTCGAGAESDVLAITVGLTPEPAISGLSLVCSGYEEMYETEAHEGSFYTWEVMGGVITSGPGTNQVTILWGDPGAGWVTVMEETEEGCSAATDVYEVSIQECTFIKEITAHEIGIYPNPARNKVTVLVPGFNNERLQLKIFNSYGEIMDNLFVNNAKGGIQINTPNYPAGVYILMIIGKDLPVESKNFLISK